MTTSPSAWVNLAAYWSGNNDKHSDRGGPEAILHLSEHLPWLLDAGDAFLDLGCGSGGVMEHIRALGKNAYGVTYQESEAAACRAKGLEVSCGDLHTLEPLGDLRWDGALLWDVIEHCVAPLVVLRNAHALLKPGGRLLIFVPGQRWNRSWYHVLVPTQTQMRHLLELAGFTQTTCIDYSSEDEGQAVYKVTK